MSDQIDVGAYKERTRSLSPSFEEGVRASVDSPRSWYVLGMLTFAYSVSYVDRQLINLLVDPIKRALLISDTEFSLIQGMAFISAYLIACPIFGRLADVSNRRNIFVFGICLWSVFTALCGHANSYWELFFARFGVGASEACALPVGWSLISDYFSARRIPRALSIYQLSPLIGGGFSLVAGGFIIASASTILRDFSIFNGLAAWQLAFVLVGLPGLLLAFLVIFTVREPTRGQSFKAQKTRADRGYTIREASGFLWSNRGFYARIYLGVGMYGIIVLGMSAWVPSFLIRFYGVSHAWVGYRYGVVVLACGAAGGLLGPWISTLLERRGHADSALRASSFAMFGTMLFCGAIPFAPTAEAALAITAGAVFCSGLPTGILAAATQLSTPSRMRGVVGSLYTFFAMLIGLGFGPTAIAFITDKVFHDPKMVGYSIAIICATASGIGTWVLYSALPHYRHMLGREFFGEA